MTPDWEQADAEPPKKKRKSLVEIITPDMRPSDSRCLYTDEGRYLRVLLEIKDAYGKRLGVMLISVEGKPNTGRLAAEGVSTFTWEQVHGRS